MCYTALVILSIALVTGLLLTTAGTVAYVIISILERIDK